MLIVWAFSVPRHKPVRIPFFVCFISVLFASLACQQSLQNASDVKAQKEKRAYKLENFPSSDPAHGLTPVHTVHTTLANDKELPLPAPTTLSASASVESSDAGGESVGWSTVESNTVTNVVSDDALLGAAFQSPAFADEVATPPHSYPDVSKSGSEVRRPRSRVSSHNLHNGIVSDWSPALRRFKWKQRGTTTKEVEADAGKSVDAGQSGSGANVHTALRRTFGGLSESVSIPSPLAHSLLYRTRDIANPLNFAHLLAEGKEWIIPGNQDLWGGLERRVDSFFSGLFLKTASILPNYKRNVIIFYKDFRPSMWIEMFGVRNQFLRKLASLFQGAHRMQSVYLRNLGMEIFEVPLMWRIRDFIATILNLDNFVSHVYTDHLVSDFDQEVQTALLPGADHGPFRGSAETPGDRTADSGGVHGGATGTRGARPRRLDVMTNDPYTWQQWAIIDSGPSRWGIEAPPAWDLWTGQGLKPRFTVAVIDSGVDYEHPDLVNQIWRNPDEICGNGIDDDFNGFVDDCIGWDFVDGTNKPMDENGHGTASAGIIAAEPNNGIGLTGVCWGCEIVVIKALNKDIKGTISAFARSLDYAIGKGVRITNNSYGGRGSGFKALEQAVERARQAGMIVVAAAGNYNGNNDNDRLPVYPASYDLDNIVSVAAISRSGHLAPFSSYGKRQVDVAAPGTNIVTTSAQKTYRSVSGTSFAVPMVTGILALLWTHRPYLTYRQVIERLLSNVKKNEHLNDLIATGGVVDAWRSLASKEFTDSHAAGLAPAATCAYAPCSPYATCTDVNGAARCVCRGGFQGDGKTCVDIDECIFSPCGPASVCVNTVGSYQCICRKGFLQTQDSCNDIDECLLGAQNLIPSPCPPQARCRNYSGSFDCVCPMGTVWNSLSGPAARCLRINPPVTGPCTGNGGCGINALCQMTITPTATARKCVCVKGYKSLQLDNPDVAAVLATSRLRSFDNTVCIREDILQEEQAFYLLSSHKDRVRDLRQGLTSFNVNSTAHIPNNHGTASIPRPVQASPSVPSVIVSSDVPTPLTAGRLSFAPTSPTGTVPSSAASAAVPGISPNANTPLQVHAPFTPVTAGIGLGPQTYTPASPVANPSCLFGVCV